MPIVVTDTSAGLEDRPALEQACAEADVIVLVFECGMPMHLPTLPLDHCQPAVAGRLCLATFFVFSVWQQALLAVWPFAGCLRGGQGASACAAAGSSASLKRIDSHWMPELKQMGLSKPVILCGCKSDVVPEGDHLQKVQSLCAPQALPLAAPQPHRP